MEKSTSKRFRRRPLGAVAAFMSEHELARLGDGKVAYIKTMTADEARKAFPSIEGLPKGINLFALHGADGTPLALTDSRSAALGHAMGDELEIIPIH